LDDIEAASLIVEEAHKRACQRGVFGYPGWDLRDEQKRTKQSKLTARNVALMCLEAFEELSGSKATRRSKDGKAYGPFLEFVSDAFEALEINASPENSVKEALLLRRKKIVRSRT